MAGEHEVPTVEVSKLHSAGGSTKHRQQTAAVFLFKQPLKLREVPTSICTLVTCMKTFFKDQDSTFDALCRITQIPYFL